MNTNGFQMRAARANRQEQTEAEAMLWELLRNRKFEDIKFRRQHPIKDYIVHFFSYELKLVIELDGGYHQSPEQKEKDELRDLHLQALGYKVLRYKNEIVENGQETSTIWCVKYMFEQIQIIYIYYMVCKVHVQQI